MFLGNIRTLFNSQIKVDLKTVLLKKWRSSILLILTPINFSSLTWSERISADLGYSDVLIFF